jgi:hypothetical protein
MITQIDQSWWFKLNGATRLLLASGAAKWGWFPLLNEYPKSGGSWMAQMLSVALDLRFPRNRLPHAGSCLLHGHYQPTYIGTEVISVHRDGRDVMVSLYFHRIVGNEHSRSSVAQHAREAAGIADIADIKGNLPRFIEALVAGRLHPSLDWGRFVSAWHGNPHVRAVTSYEAMQADAAGALITVMSALDRSITPTHAAQIAGQFSFERQAQRKAGVENSKSYLRKGVVGDWRNHFTAEAAQIFDHHMGDALIALGYERNRDWVATAGAI